MTEFPSELRYDVASKDWVVIATGRAKRPEMFKIERRKGKPEQECPFCRMEGQRPPTLAFYQGQQVPLPGGGEIPDQWTTIVIPNLYPAFKQNEDLNKRKEGPLYRAMDAVGFHEVVVTSDHQRHLAQFSLDRALELIEVYHRRFLDLKDQKFVNHISIFHNHGFEAGASIAHPHSQIITTPLIDTDLRSALSTSEEYFNQTGDCIYCNMADWEMKVQKRVVFENEDFLVICPFASKAAFEVIISPKQHSAYFEEITESKKQSLAKAFLQALGRLDKALNDPPYNFYLHSAPCDGKDYSFYHWHWTILPKTATWAGFELGAGMEISTIEPEAAAEYLREI